MDPPSVAPSGCRRQAHRLHINKAEIKAGAVCTDHRLRVAEAHLKSLMIRGFSADRAVKPVITMAYPFQYLDFNKHANLTICNPLPQKIYPLYFLDKRSILITVSLSIKTPVMHYISVNMYLFPIRPLTNPLKKFIGSIFSYTYYTFTFLYCQPQHQKRALTKVQFILGLLQVPFPNISLYFIEVLIVL